jgi:Ca2+-transporting ATPase
VGAVMLTVTLQFIIIYVPFLGVFFSTQALAAEEILLSIALSSVIFWAVEIEKFIMRRRDNISRNRGY